MDQEAGTGALDGVGRRSAKSKELRKARSPPMELWP